MAEGTILTFIRILLICASLILLTDGGSVALNQPGDEVALASSAPASPTPDSSNKFPESSAPIAAATPAPPSNGMIRTTLPFSMGHLGMIECEGAERGSDFLQQIFGEGVNFNRSDFLCGPTCRGSCVPRPPDVGIPPSIYPFGCSCEMQGCNEDGPLIAPLIKPTFKIACKQDPHCTCVGMGPGQYTGYSCHWLNTETLLPVTFKLENPLLLPGPADRPSTKLPPKFNSRFFPISWCSCCPRFPIVRND